MFLIFFYRTRIKWSARRRTVKPAMQGARSQQQTWNFGGAFSLFSKWRKRVAVPYAVLVREQLFRRPGDELVFENKGPERDSSDFIELTNCTDSFVAFKVKTTAPEKFRVKPSFGWIESGGSRTVEVSIQPGKGSMRSFS